MSSKGVNKVILIGNLGNDPDMRAMPNGSQVANISVATSEAWKDKNTGEVIEKKEWHRVVFFGKLAEIVGQYLRKGSKIYIEGKLQTRQWEKDGVKRYSTEIVVDQRGTMQMLDSKPVAAGGHGQAQQRQAAQEEQPSDEFSDDIPF